MHASLARLAAGAAAMVALVAPADAAASAIPGVVLVRPSGARGVQALARSPAVDGTIASLAGGVRLVAVSADPATAVARLRRTRGIRWAEPDVLLHATAAPDDPLLAQQTDLPAMAAGAGWDAFGLGAFPRGGGVPVGIVDTGVDRGHPDLAGRIAACGEAARGVVSSGACDDDEGHGTHVAGTVGAGANDGIGMAGIAFDSPLIVCRALTAGGGGDTADVAACITWVHQQGARIISMSLGGPPSRTLAAAAQDAYARGGRAGSVLVAAAGNDGDGSTEYPAGLSQVISVAATDDAGGHAPFSNVNADVEIAAPGVDVLSARLGGGYVRESGTSMAAPHVAAAAALIWSAAPDLTAAGVRERLDRAVDDAGQPGRDGTFGYGRLDLEKAAR